MVEKMIKKIIRRAKLKGKDSFDELRKNISGGSRRSFLPASDACYLLYHGFVETTAMKTMTINNWRKEIAEVEQMFEAISQNLSSLPGKRLTETVLLGSEDNDWRFFEKIPQGVIRYDSKGRIQLANHAGERLLGSTMASIKGRRLWDPSWRIIREDGSVFTSEQHPEMIALNTGEPVMNVVMGVFSPDGEHGRWYIVNSVPEFKTGTDKPDTVISIFTDITERKEAEEKNRLASVVVENTGEGIFITGHDNKIISVNRAFKIMTGYTEQEVLGKSPHNLQSRQSGDTTNDEIWNTLRDNNSWQGEIWNFRKNNEPFPTWTTISSVQDENDRIIYYVYAFTEITSLKQTQEQLGFLAYHDPLTELPNRLLMNDRIDHALQNSQRNGLQFAVFFLDLDNFKDINDTFGHSIGDLSLKEVAARIKALVREEDTVSRLAGDEFIILVEDIADIKNIAKLARKIIDAFQTPFCIQGYQLDITASIGISVFPDDGTDAMTLINAADAAMYHAKQEGRNNFQFDIAAFTVAALEKLNMENALRLALQNKELFLYYQPQISLSSGDIVGVESLLRWQHPTLGMILPSQFIPIAEETGLINSLGAWMLETACKQMKTWIREGFPAEKMAVNISGKQLLSSDIVKTVRQSLETSGLEPCYLELEFSESDLTNSMERSIDFLSELKHLGVNVAIDGYGTGCSSLNHLIRLPVSKLKIDRSLVQGQLRGTNNQEIVGAVIALGHSLRLEVLADGIETEVQQQMLFDMGCDVGQGDLYALPSQP